MTEFDYQWKNLPDPLLELNPQRVQEFLDLVQLPAEWFKGKLCLDAGCGSGRWTWGMMQLNARVMSVDISESALFLCRSVNPKRTFKLNIESYRSNRPHFDFVLCWGVLHHLKAPIQGFRNVAACVKPGGYLHIMVYHQENQRKYSFLRKIWRLLPGNYSKRWFCSLLSSGIPFKTEHGWWDALNPRYNHGYYPSEIRKWFEDEGFEDITLTREFSINFRGRKV
jgi:2-polyprenyl-3-methyl-5-hydroxy-6-metoxy-1,4-benzoquinol methylase